MNKDVITYTGVSATSGLAMFIEKSLAEIYVWLLVIFFVILADLCMGVSAGASVSIAVALTGVAGVSTLVAVAAG